MADWLKVFKLSPGATVLVVNEQLEQPNHGDAVIRSELRFRGRIVTQRHRQESAAALAENFALIDAQHAANWVINVARKLENGVPCRG